MYTPCDRYFVTSGERLRTCVCIISVKSMPHLDDKVSKFSPKGRLKIQKQIPLQEYLNIIGFAIGNTLLCGRPGIEPSTKNTMPSCSKYIRSEMLKIVGQSHLTPSQSLQFSQFLKCRGTDLQSAPGISLRKTPRTIPLLITGAPISSGNRGTPPIPSYQISISFPQE